MRILLLFFVSIHFAFSQDDPLFKIISCSEGVTLDGNEVTPGTPVYSNSKKLEIPKKGYAGVITIDGYALKFSSSTRVIMVTGTAELYDKPIVRSLSGAVHRPVPRFKFAVNPNSEFSQIFGDSIFIAFINNYNDKPPFKFRSQNMFDDILVEDTLNGFWKIYNVKDLFKNETSILVEISSGQNRSERILIKKTSMDLLQSMKYDFARLQEDPIASIALCEINDLYFDLIFHLYKTEKLDVSSLDPISTAYLARIKDKYQLSQYYNQVK